MTTTTGMRWAHVVLPIALLTLACSGATKPSPSGVAVVAVTPATHTMFVGEEVRLSVVLKDDRGRELEGRSVVWSAEPASVASVTADGKVVALAPGVAHVSAESEGKRDQATITIQARPVVPVATVEVSPATLELTVGSAQTLTVVVKDAFGNSLDGRTVAWSSTDAAVAEVDGAGRVSGKAVGTATIRAESEGKQGTSTITVRAIPVAAVTLNTHRLDLDIGTSAQLEATARDANGAPLAGREIIWSSSNPAIAAVTNLSGRVIARGGGTATITATVDGKSDAATVVVTELPGFAYDLIYDRWSGSSVILPELYRVDIRTVDAAPRAVLQFPAVSDATASPNGDKIAYVAADGGHTSIFVADADGNNAHRLTTGPLSADQPAWSPDETRIAYRVSANSSPARVWVMNADGTNQHAITNDAPGEHHHPTWSPRQSDGSYRIAYSQAALSEGYMRAQLWSVRDDGTDRRAITDASSGSYDDEASWSPDGTKIVFVRAGPANAYELLVVNVQDGSVSSLFSPGFDPEGEQHAPAWSPDGTLIAFVSSHEIDSDGYEKQIYTVRPNGSGLRRRTFDNTDKGNPAWIRR